MAIMPKTGNSSAAVVATQLMHDFPRVSFGLLVGIGGGVPAVTDVRLGDVVVSQPHKLSGGVIQYDLGKRLPVGKFERTGQSNEPPWILTSHVRKLEAQHRRVGNKIWAYLSEMFDRYPRMKAEYSYPEDEPDQLFIGSYQHQQGDTCGGCDPTKLVLRRERPDHEPRIHYGIMGSANVVVRDAETRDKLSQDMNMICVDMEAAGLINNFPCLVIRGICDYADSHKNERYQVYAGAVAAAYLKELLLILPQEPTEERRVVEETSSPAKFVPRKSVISSQLVHGVQKFEISAYTALPHNQCIMNMLLAFNSDKETDMSKGICLRGAPALDPNLFVGRVNELEQMDNTLIHAATSQRRLVIGGMAGVGKTQLAVAFARRHYHNLEFIIWLNARSEATLKFDLRLIVQHIDSDVGHEIFDQGQALSRFSHWLSQPENSRWLLIFDNHDEPDALSIEDFCPPMFQGDWYAHRLTERLGGLPLALATVGVYLRKSSLAVEQYYQQYTEHWSTHCRRPTQLDDYNNGTLYTTWNASYQQLRRYDHNAALLLQLLVYFGNQYITHELFVNAHTRVHRMHQWPFRGSVTQSALENLMRSLSRFYFVELRPESQSYSISPCVHDWMLSGLNMLAPGDIHADPHYVDVALHSIALDCIVDTVPENLDYNQYRHHARLKSHAERVVCKQFLAADCWWGISTLRGRLVTKRLSTLLFHVYSYDAASTLLEKAVSEYERHGQHDGSISAYYVRAIVRLAMIHADRDMFRHAELHYLRALSVAEKFLEPDHEETLVMLHAYGTLRYRQSRTDEAQELQETALYGSERAFGSGDKRTLQKAPGLGTVYRRLGDYSKAILEMNRWLSHAAKSFSLSNYYVLHIIHDLGLSLLSQGNLLAAEEKLEACLAGYGRLFGPENYYTLRPRYDLGRLQMEKGDLEKAESILRPLAAIEMKLLGPDHPDTERSTETLDKVIARRNAR